MKTMQIGTFEAKNRLSELLEKAARGQRILITRRGQGLAVLCAPEAVGGDGSASEADANIVRRLRAFRNHARPGTETAKALIEEGRR